MATKSPRFIAINYTCQEYTSAYASLAGAKLCMLIRDQFIESGRWGDDNIRIMHLANPEDLDKIWKSFNHVAIFQADVPPVRVYFETLPDGSKVRKAEYVSTDMSTLNLMDLLQVDEELEALGDEPAVSDMQFVLEAARDNPTLQATLEAMPCWKTFREALSHISPSTDDAVVSALPLTYQNVLACKLGIPSLLHN